MWVSVWVVSKLKLLDVLVMRMIFFMSDFLVEREGGSEWLLVYVVVGV